MPHWQCARFFSSRVDHQGVTHSLDSRSPLFITANMMMAMGLRPAIYFRTSFITLTCTCEKCLRLASVKNARRTESLPFLRKTLLRWMADAGSQYAAYAIFFRCFVMLCQLIKEADNSVHVHAQY
jgi:hypothetical protein